MAVKEQQKVLNMKSLRIILWCAVAIMAGLSGYLWLSQKQPLQVANQSAVKIGSPFNLVSHTGAPITEAALQGRRHAMFFGFTHCPDICPTTLLQTAGWMKKLGTDSEKIDFYFFTVDPERDTPEIMSDYVNAFDPRITGVTGSSEEITKMLKGYKVYAKRVDLEDDDYTMDHSAFVMLFRSDGSFQGTISFDENEEAALAKLQRLIKSG
ncbi:MAG: SCO family protein [Pseudomonadota bacterium]